MISLQLSHLTQRPSGIEIFFSAAGSRGVFSFLNQAMRGNLPAGSGERQGTFAALSARVRSGAAETAPAGAKTTTVDARPTPASCPRTPPGRLTRAAAST